MFFSLIGIMLTIIPVFIVIFGAYISIILQYTYNILIKITRFVIKQLIYPIIEFLHENGFIELFLYFFCF
jgi:hypothetical protein